MCAGSCGANHGAKIAQMASRTTKSRPIPASGLRRRMRRKEMVSAATGRKSIVTRKDVDETAFRRPLATALDIGNAERLQHCDSVWKNLSFRATHSDPLVGSECEVGEPAFANLFRRTLLRLFR